MKNELAPRQPHCTSPGPQDPTIDESRICGLTREAFGLSIQKKGYSPKEALDRLVRMARGDSGQCRIVGKFLLAWWNAAEYGGFDLTDVWAVDAAIAKDMIAVLALLVNCRCYPDSLGYGPQFQTIAKRWR